MKAIMIDMVDNQNLGQVISLKSEVYKHKEYESMLKQMDALFDMQIIKYTKLEAKGILVLRNCFYSYPNQKWTTLEYLRKYDLTYQIEINL